MAVNEDKIKFTIHVPIELDGVKRKQIGERVIKRVVDRTRTEYKDKNNKKFPDYSEAYKKSLDFKNAGKSPNEVNLTLTGDMLDDLSIIEHGVGYIDIGYTTGYSGAGKVEGNVIGSYGKKANDEKARNFLGIKKNELNQIIDEISQPTGLEEINKIIEQSVDEAVKRILENVEIG